MRKCWLTILLLLMFCASTRAGQQEPVSSLTPAESLVAQWKDVMNLTAGSRLRVREIDGRSREGGLQSVGDDRLTILLMMQPVEVPRSSIRSIDRVAGRQTRRRAFRGLLIGVAAGALQGTLLVEGNRQFWIPVFATGWGVIGTLVGSLNGWHTPGYVPVYEMR